MKEINEKTLDFLLEFLNNDKNFSDVISMGYKLLNNPILLVDSTYQLVAHSDDELDDIVWNELLENGHCSNKLITTFIQENLLQELNNIKNPIYTNTGFSKELPRIISKIEYNKKLVGFIGVFEYNKKFVSKDYKVINYLCSILGFLLKNKEYDSNTEEDVYFLNLIKGDNIKTNEQIDIKNKLGLKNNQMYRLYIISEKQNEDSYTYILNQHHHLIKRYSCVVWSIVKEQYLIILTTEYITEKQNFEHLIKDLLNDNLFCGISDPFTLLEEIASAYNQANIALLTGQKILSNKNLFYFHNYWIHFLVDSICENSQQKLLAHTGPAKLLKYDQENDTDYYNTLYLYLESNCSTSQAASKMYIHRNTMYKRIIFIQQFLKIDLEDVLLKNRLLLTYYMLNKKITNEVYTVL